MTENPFELKNPEIAKHVEGILDVVGVKTKKIEVGNNKDFAEFLTGEKKVGDNVHVEFSKSLVDQKVIQVIYGNIPSKSNCYKIITFKSKDPNKSHASLAKTKALSQYEKDFYIQCNKYRNAAIDEYFTLELDVYYPSQRSDLDNCLKVLLDCLQKVNAIKNDNKCVRIVANKFLDAKNPRVEFVIKKAM